ncbi:unnamed protein product, partial [Rotaria sordida]
MDDELPSESTRRSSSYPTVRSNGKACNSNSSITPSSIKINKKSRSNIVQNTTIKIKPPIIHQKSGFKKKRSSLITRKKTTVLHSTSKTKQPEINLEDLISSDDEPHIAYVKQSTSQPDLNLPVTSPINIQNEESSNNHNDSFDSNQTIDIEPDQPKRKQKKSTVKSRQDVLKYFIIMPTGELK